MLHPIIMNNLYVGHNKILCESLTNNFLKTTVIKYSKIVDTTEPSLINHMFDDKQIYLINILYRDKSLLDIKVVKRKFIPNCSDEMIEKLNLSCSFFYLLKFSKLIEKVYF